MTRLDARIDAQRGLVDQEHGYIPLPPEPYRPEQIVVHWPELLTATVFVYGLVLGLVFGIEGYAYAATTFLTASFFCVPIFMAIVWLREDGEWQDFERAAADRIVLERAFRDDDDPQDAA